MKQHGFTLVELLVVISIMSILASIATFQFRHMQRKTRIEGQVKTIYAELLNVRAQALFTKRPRTIKLSAKQFEIYSSSYTGGAPASQIALPFEIKSNSGSFTFDSSGMADNQGAICLDPENNLAASNAGNIDSIVINTARINTGKREVGGACAANVIKQN